MCKHTDCVEVCPVDCFYEGENMLVINPDECIDCGVCEPECPVDAIKADTEPDSKKWIEINKKYSEINEAIKRAEDLWIQAQEKLENFVKSIPVFFIALLHFFSESISNSRSSSSLILIQLLFLILIL